MLKSLFSLILICLQTISFAIDFDVIVVGTSPIALLEALYRYHSGNKVLILEGASECGGAWKSVDVCGVSHVDLGCHTLGNDFQMHNFLEEYVGCKIVSMDNPHQPFDVTNSPNGFYFARGCYEMVNNLLDLVKATDIVLLVDQPIESIYVDPANGIATAKSKGSEFTTSKILVTNYSGIQIENIPSTYETPAKSKYYHLYLLIEDSSPPRFTYHGGIGHGISRMMNLSSFIGLEGSGMHLIVIQTHNEMQLQQSETFIDQLKKHGLIDFSARLVDVESYVYEQSKYNCLHVQQMKEAKAIFEMIGTDHIQNMSGLIPKWKKVLKPFHMAISSQ